MLQKHTEPDRDFLSFSNPAADWRWIGPDQRHPLDSLQLALNNVREIARGDGLWNEFREGAGLRVRIGGQKEIAWLALSGELDRASLPLIEESLALAQSGHDSIVVDLEDLEFMDSSGIEAFLRAEIRARAAGGRVRVVNVHKHQRIFVICSARSLLSSGVENA